MLTRLGYAPTFGVALFVLWLVGSPPANADQVWNITGKEKIKTKGYKDSWETTDRFTMFDNGKFTTEDIANGSWIRKKSKTKLYLTVPGSDINNIIDSFAEDIDADYHVDRIKKFSLTASISRKKQILKGSLKIILYITIPDWDLFNRKVTITGTYKGYPAPQPASSGGGKPTYKPSVSSGRSASGGSPVDSPTPQVPEPAAALMLGLGAMGLFRRKRRR